ncbi:MAG: hypothetical protein AB2A00_01470 [Myxococcota bacterium]
MRRVIGFSVAVLLAAVPAGAVEKGEEVEVTSGAVTALSCALAARESGKLDGITACPLAEAQKEIVVVDVAEMQIYRISSRKVFRFELEKAFGGGSIDFTGKVVKLDKKTGVATVDVEEYTVARKPKPGAFKGCL